MINIDNYPRDYWEDADDLTPDEVVENELTELIDYVEENIEEITTLYQGKHKDRFVLSFTFDNEVCNVLFKESKVEVHYMNKVTSMENNYKYKEIVDFIYDTIKINN